MALITVVFADDGGNGQTTAAPRAPEGSVLLPRRGDRVAPAFTAEGTLAAVPRGRHVWLAVQAGNLLFPKEPEIPREDQRWSQEVVEGGNPGRRFSLALLMVDEGGQRVIEDWLVRGRRGAGFPALERIPGSVKLDVVRGLALK